MQIEQKSLDYGIIALYIILIFEMLWVVWKGFLVLEVSLLMLGSLALGVRLISTTLQPRLTPWVKIRYFLHNILSVQKILPPMDEAIAVDIQEEIELEIEEIKQILLPPEQEFVDEIRSIGVDGLLILMYLMKRAPSYCTARILGKDLHIPIATVYRSIDKMENMDLLEKSYTIDKPNTAIIRGTSQGESIILKLFDMFGGYQSNFLPK